MTAPTRHGTNGTAERVSFSKAKGKERGYKVMGSLSLLLAWLEVSVCPPEGRSKYGWVVGTWTKDLKHETKQAKACLKADSKEQLLLFGLLCNHDFDCWSLTNRSENKKAPFPVS
ncbi:peptidyl-tRNA hydrolase [Striga asiatica]|uniref:Peptidyl-tRNA hydrolase n=1 Tax=Striga asiatica TaxID=4170 RepID=A0A5A7QMI3_STRAF|nr:peptidyl-tRNA hydrolase [Striga asiatica]